MAGPAYSPELAPVTVDADLARFLDNELKKIGAAFTLVRDHDVLTSAPDRPRRGLVVYADGTNWNPGSGEGLYRFNGSTWVFVG